ncbi:MAG: LamG-like jellyroll fold domain-containing protein [Planctomycetota bacterium]
MKKTISIVLVLTLGLASVVAKADFTFGEPTNLGPISNSSAADAVPTISGDGLELYFTSDRPGGQGGNDIWVTTRDTIDDEWGTPMNLGPTVNSSFSESSPNISADGLTLYFTDWPSPRPGGVGGVDIWGTTRPTNEDEWGVPMNLGPTVNTGARDGGPSISADGLALFLYSNRSAGYGSNDIWVARRETIHDPWGTPVNLGPTVNTSSGECCPNISADGLSLFHGSRRPGGYGDNDLWVTTRATVSDPWGPSVNLGPTVNSSAGEDDASIWADGLIFTSNRPGGVGSYDLWQVSIAPIVDFNGDGIVDCADICMMTEHWLTNEPLCDIGPMPWGDGIVDVQDLTVLAEYLFTYPGAVAYWKLDETEGDIAYDSAAVNDAVVFGGAVWQPASGAVDGALEFDGSDDYVSAPYVLNPTDGPFSVFAWTKGGAPGQVVISQTEGVDWLSVDSVGGNLMTELRYIGGRVVQPLLLSQTVIADGEWHRIGFVWDGVYRTLYVDDTLVAEDSQPGLADSLGGLNIGCGSDLAAGTFWSGLIDDVRIYNRAIRP